MYSNLNNPPHGVGQSPPTYRFILERARET
jgi:hypothetical protein